MGTIFKNILEQKRMKYLLAVVAVTFITITITIAFAAFTVANQRELTNINVFDLEFSFNIDGNQTRITDVANNSITFKDVTITSENDIPSRYELIYQICTDSSCTSFIQNLLDFEIRWSSITIDPVTESMASDGTRTIRVAIINNTSEDQFIKFGVNAGFSHNTLALQRNIVNEHPEIRVLREAIMADNPLRTGADFSQPGMTLAWTNPDFPNWTEELWVSPESTGHWWFGTSYTFNHETGRYQLSGTITQGWDESKVGQFTFGDIWGTETSESQWITRITGVGEWGLVSVSKGAQHRVVEFGGLYATEDDFGTSYFFRGSHHLNNNIIFAGHQWKILRIDGNGDVRLLYNGVCATPNCRINTRGQSLPGGTRFNNNPTDIRHVGYMFGNTCTSYATCHANENDSSIKIIVDEFIDSLPQIYQDLLIPSEFCNDRSLVSGTGVPGSSTVFGAVQRMNNHAPTLKCPQQNDRLTLIAGLPSADELAKAGGVMNQGVPEAFFAGSGHTALISAASWGTGNTGQSFWFSRVSGVLETTHATAGNQLTVRPVITISGDTLVDRRGSETRAFIVQ